MAILEILKYTIPSIVVLLTAYFLVKRFLDNSEKKRLLELKYEQQKITQQTVVPIRMQAYERLMLLLERTAPNHVVLRVNTPGMGVRELQTAMTANIRDEFEHNLSQQIYISSEAWELIKNAKEEMVNTINTSAAEAGEDVAVFVGKILERWTIYKQTSSAIALEFLKKEFNERF